MHFAMRTYFIGGFFPANIARSTGIPNTYKGPIFIKTTMETGISCSPFWDEIRNISLRLFAFASEYRFMFTQIGSILYCEHCEQKKLALKSGWEQVTLCIVVPSRDIFE